MSGQDLDIPAHQNLHTEAVLFAPQAVLQHLNVSFCNVDLERVVLMPGSEQHRKLQEPDIPSRGAFFFCVTNVAHYLCTCKR